MRHTFAETPYKEAFMRRSTSVHTMILCALLIAVGLILPLFLGQVQILAQGISPMHIPAFIAGLTCGPAAGAVVGFVTPLLRMVIFGMPAAPSAVPMAFELCAYGVLTGLLYPLLVRRHMAHLPAILISMVLAMILGRFIGGAAKAIFLGLSGGSYTFSTFVSAYFVTTAVGAVIHLILVPAVVLALEKARLSPLTRRL